MSETTPLTNEMPNDAERLAKAVTEALTDSMVERLTNTGANAMEVVDKLNDEDTRDALMYAMDRLTDLHRVGALETLFSLLELVHGAKSAMTDSMVDRLFVFVEHMATNLATEELATLAHNARRAMEEAIDETAEKPTSGGLMTTIGMLSKPETQQALQLMLAFSSKLQSRAVALRGSPEIEGN